MKTKLKKISIEQSVMLPDDTPIFLREDKTLVGMVIKENTPRGKRWIASLSGSKGATGYHETRVKCLLSLNKYYTFYVSKSVLF